MNSKEIENSICPVCERFIEEELYLLHKKEYYHKVCYRMYKSAIACKFDLIDF